MKDGRREGRREGMREGRRQEGTEGRNWLSAELAKSWLQGPNRLLHVSFGLCCTGTHGTFKKCA